MSKYLINDTTLQSIADAIRAKKGTTEPVAVNSFASEISSIEAGGECSGKHVIEVDDLPTEDFDENAVYLSGGAYYKGSNAAFTDIVIVSSGNVFSYKELMGSCNFHTIPTKTTDGIIETTDSGYEFYYIEDEEDVFLYAEGEWILFSLMFGGDFPGWSGIIYDISEITDTTTDANYLMFGSAIVGEYHPVSGTLDITENGEYDVRNKNSVSVMMTTALMVQTTDDLPSDAPIGSIAYVLEG